MRRTARCETSPMVAGIIELRAVGAPVDGRAAPQCEASMKTRKNASAQQRAAASRADSRESAQAPGHGDGPSLVGLTPIIGKSDPAAAARMLRAVQMSAGNQAAASVV